jgi:hypothetical protein
MHTFSRRGALQIPLHSKGRPDLTLRKKQTIGITAGNDLHRETRNFFAFADHAGIL